MTIITIPPKITGKEELVIISRKELDRMKAQMLPAVFLKGRAANKLDKRVERSVKEHRTGKTERLETFLKREHPKLYQKYAG
ncbi:MAG: hypothetical protein A3I44_01385 [Candidatus Sungbacteria bacterium RIFCSPLOWO2_02_FULL_51_17]|uniref:Uncharacterized protein n=1 Tax=Candidatus Sungbacteria bacterium RIFCSPHIGHO2_02_FULL_51_29 TaxID=1802273 RepID=A0A1G2KVS0_9BACT|nr:MAG: hypothetical protein A2676_03110 [Candidatus Sungbacteria bacterium RIFCSPHIGHO2_01_FULL_51_22]OHA03535.1 MAG: hypothetical protein A3C16_00465 [Candidatus Sungbacteria bacterium RIFCSPHIGHO2_02_FULL_51_29]OHA06246.1 MAG: hypothetical protein A3B29_02435 [Candidatus Sungbacteria bacterium RIFCSPLOWO2_01_FULL_51_34]OHA10770.1 MAG: hypothetical protein A3I44_01385 [Candidatus Sungbacteria bacterium RIFCSPLOWO2_02_FULL_51_17]